MLANQASVQIGKTALSTFVNYFSTDRILLPENIESCMEKMKLIPSLKMKSVEPAKTAGVLVPLCIDNGEMSLLYTLRSMDLTSHKGQVSFPGGKYDLSDGNLTETAIRETEEELGISRKSIEIWGEANSYPGKNFDILVTPVVGFIKNYDPSMLNVNPREVDEVFTVPLKVLADPEYFGFTNFKNGWTLPVFMGGKHKIWGLTATFTHLFLSCLLPKSEYSMQFQYMTFPKKFDKDLFSKI